MPAELAPAGRVTRAVVVMGKVPRAGRVKTRLTTRYTAAQAAELYEAFLTDTFRLVDRARGTADWARVFACALDDGDELARAERLAPLGWRVVAQQGEGLGDRIDHARRAGAAEHVLVMGSDCPTLDPARLTEAFAALSEADRPSAALVPTEDGGYALIGFNRALPALLDGIPWSTGAVMQATVAAADTAGITLFTLPEAYDIDHPEDLMRAMRDVDPEHHPSTHAALAALGRNS